MKKSFNFFAMAAAALALISSCQKNELADNTMQTGRKLHFVIKTGDVKTSIEYDNAGNTYTPYWDGADQLGLYFTETTADGSIQVLTNSNPKGKVALFKGDITVPEGKSEGTFYSFVPAQRFEKFYSTFPRFGFNLGDKNDDYKQHPLKNSFDPLCDLLLASPTYYYEEGGEVLIDNICFARMFSILKVQLTGDIVAGDKVGEIKIAGEGLTLSGRFHVDPVNMTLPQAAAAKNYVWAEYAEAEQPVMGTDAIYLVVNPQTVAQGTALSIIAETDKHSIEKTLILTKGAMDLKQGKVITLNVTIAEGDYKVKTKEGYILQTTSGAFEAGAKYILAFKDGKDGSYYFINNKGTSNTLSKDAYEVIDGKIVTTETDCVFTAETSSTAGCFTLKNSNGGYIYNKGDNTTLNTNNTTSAAWLPTFLTASQTYKLQVNNASGRYIGAASAVKVGGYANSNFKDQVAGGTAIDQYVGAISVFKYDDGKLPLPTPANLAVNGMTVSWDAVSGAGSYKVTVNGVETSVNTNSYDYTGAAGYYDVSVYAVPDETASATYKNSEAATLTKAKFGEPVLETPVLESNGVTASSVSAKWTVDPNASNGYLCQLYNGEDFVSDQTVSTGAVTFTNLTEDTEYTVKVQAKAVAGTYAYAASGVASIKLTPAGLHIKDITSEGTYNIGGLLVYAVSGNNVILGDNTGKILFYNSNHGLSVGDKVDVNGEVIKYNGVWEFKGATTSNKTTGNPVDHGTPIELSTISSYSTVPTVTYVHATGTQDDSRNITTDGTNSYKLYLSADNESTAGKPVDVTGYTYGYYTSKSTISFLALDIHLDGISVDPSSVTLGAESGSTAKVSVVSSVAWTANTSSDWTVSPASGNAGTTEVTITASKAGGDAEATLADLVFTQTGTSKSATVTVKQQKTGGGTTKYVKVTLTTDLTNGTYLIVYEKSSTEARIFNGLDAANDYVSSTITNSEIASSADVDKLTVTISAMTGGYSIKIDGGDKAGNYIYGKSGSNSIQYGKSAVANEITFSNGLATILSDNTSLRYNSQSGNDRFRYYKTTTTGKNYIYPALYKKVN